MIGRKNPYRELERALGYRFRRRALLEQALTHPSFAHEQTPELPDNQRFEFLGDAVLGLAAAEFLYEAHPDSDEGKLTRLRSLLTSTKALAHLATALNLGAYLRLGNGEDQDGGRTRPSILADALEAILGAAYLDGGHKAADKIFQCVFTSHRTELIESPQGGNPKGALQERAQSAGLGIPRYHLAKEEGPPHHKTFTAEVYIGSDLRGVGQGHTKREAESRAAQQALQTFNPHRPDS